MNHIFLQKENGLYSISNDLKLAIKVAEKSVNQIDYSMNEEKVRRAEKDLITELTGLSNKRIIMLKQVHGDEIVLIKKEQRNDSIFFAEADAAITSLPEICLVIRTADCVPVIAFDKKNKILGAAHSGWRGCNLAITNKMILKMKTYFNSKSEDISAFILPSIGPESYTVNEDVARLFKDHTIRRDNKIYLNLWESIEKSLADEGVLNIYSFQKCTVQNNAEYFSYRCGDNGRNLNFAYMEQ